MFLLCWTNLPPAGLAALISRRLDILCCCLLQNYIQRMCSLLQNPKWLSAKWDNDFKQNWSVACNRFSTWHVLHVQMSILARRVSQTLMRPNVYLCNQFMALIQSTKSVDYIYSFMNTDCTSCTAWADSTYVLYDVATRRLEETSTSYISLHYQTCSNWVGIHQTES